jgi:hypothetical protein
LRQSLPVPQGYSAGEDVLTFDWDLRLHQLEGIDLKRNIDNPFAVDAVVLDVAVAVAMIENE